MIESLHLKNFRRFEDYHLSDLRRVCLLVGENNSGKTSVLEAAHFWALSDSAALRLAAERRGEEVYAELEKESKLIPWFPTIEHFIHNHRIEPGASLVVETPRHSTTLEVVPIDGIDHVSVIGHFRDLGARVVRSGNSGGLEEFPIRYDGAFDSIRMSARASIRRRSSENVLFLDCEISPRQLRSLWDAVNEAGLEGQVIESIQIVTPEVESLYFAALPEFHRNPRVGIHYRRGGERSLTPIGSLGSAAFRLLEFGVTLVYCRSGICLVDDIDTGLHWSLMGDMWRMVIETARRNDTQVFATTHSHDCIKGLAWVCENYPDLADEVSVQSIKAELDQAVAMPGDRLPFVMGQEIEVR